MINGIIDICNEYRKKKQGKDITKIMEKIEFIEDTFHRNSRAIWVLLGKEEEQRIEFKINESTVTQKLSRKANESSTKRK